MTTIEPTGDGVADVDDVGRLLDLLEAAVGGLQATELDQLTAKEELAVQRRIETIRRQLDHATDRSAGILETSGAFAVDGHRNAKSAIKAIGRVAGAEAHQRLQTARALRHLPLVEAAYAAGQTPTAHVRAIARAVSNPRVTEHVEGADPILADAATRLGYDDFLTVLRQWEAYADADGTGECAEQTHERRHLSLTENPIDDSGYLEGSFGNLQTAVLKETLERFEEAEFLADWAAARKTHGTDARIEHLPRTARQRRADALVEIFRRAGTAGGGRTSQPLVNIVIDQETFEDELRRAAGEDVDVDPNHDLEGRRCHTVGGTPLHPADVVAAALVGHVRRVVVDAARPRPQAAPVPGLLARGRHAPDPAPLPRRAPVLLAGLRRSRQPGRPPHPGCRRRTDQSRQRRRVLRHPQPHQGTRLPAGPEERWPVGDAATRRDTHHAARLNPRHEPPCARRRAMITYN